MTGDQKLLLLATVLGFILGWASCFLTLRIAGWAARRRPPVRSVTPSKERIYFPGPDGATLAMDRATLDLAKAAANRELQQLSRKS